MGFIARCEAMAHRLQVDAVPTMRMSNHDGLIHLGVESIPLELAHLSRDLDSKGHKQSGSLRLHHLKVIAYHSEGRA